MLCKKFQLMIHRSLDKELGEADCRLLDDHLRRCGACRAFLEQEKKLKSAFHPANVEPPEELRGRILASLRAEAGQNGSGLRTAEPNGVIVLLLFRRAAAAALVFLAVSAGIFFGRQAPLTAAGRGGEVHYEDVFSRTEPGEALHILLTTTKPEDALRLLERPAADPEKEER